MNKKSLFTIAATILISLLFFFRFYKLYEFVTFLSDQGRDAIILKRIITFEHFPAIGAPSSVGQVYLGPFYYYLVAPFLGLFNFDPVGPAIGVAILSIVGIFVAYLAVKKEVSPAVTLIFLAFSTFSTILTEYSRFSWNPNLLPYFSFMTLFFFHQWLEKPTVRDGIIFGALLGFSIQLHYLGALLGVPIALFILWKLVEIRSIKKHSKSFIAAGISFILSISPLILFDLRHDFLNYRQFFKLFTEGNLASGSSYLFRLDETIQGFINHGLQLSFSPLISKVIFILILTLGLLVYKYKKSKFVLLHVCNFLIFIFGFAFLSSGRFPHYYGPAIMSLYLVLASLIILIKQIKIQYTLAGIFIILFAYLNITKMYFLFANGNNQIQHAKIVATSMGKKINHQPFNFATWPVDLGEDSYLYFLELDDMPVADREKLEVTDQLIVICEKEPCMLLDSPSWNISMFGKAQIQDQWEVEGLKIFKLVHDTAEGN